MYLYFSSINPLHKRTIATLNDKTLICPHRDLINIKKLFYISKKFIKTYGS